MCITFFALIHPSPTNKSPFHWGFISGAKFSDWVINYSCDWRFLWALLESPPAYAWRRSRMAGRELSLSNVNSNLLLWCGFTTTLEHILAKISDFGERLRAAAKRRLRLKQNFLYILSVLRAPDFLILKESKILGSLT